MRSTPESRSEAAPAPHPDAPGEPAAEPGPERSGRHGPEQPAERVTDQPAGERAAPGAPGAPGTSSAASPAAPATADRAARPTTDDLRAVFAERSKGGPPNPDRQRELQRRIHRRRRRLIGGAAIGGVAVVAVGALAATTVLWPAEPAAAPPVPPAESELGRASYPNLRPSVQRPIAELWPEAVHRIPKRLPDGRTITPETFLDRGTLLVSAGKGERKRQVMRYDLATRTVAPVAPIALPSDRAKAAVGPFATGDDHVVWAVDHGGDDPRTYEIWAAPLAAAARSGSRKARRIALMETSTARAAAAVDDLTVVDGKATWSSAGGEGVYQVPLTGGTAGTGDVATPLPGTRGYHLVMWPWVGHPGGSPATWTLSNASYTVLRNVRTGERRDARLQSTAGWRCGVTWCLGVLTKDRYTPGVVPNIAQRRDGTGKHTYLHSLPLAGTNNWLPGRDRFVVSTASRSLGGRSTYVLHDLVTRRSGDLGLPTEKPTRRGDRRIWKRADFPPLLRPSSDLYCVEFDDDYLVVNLSAIE